MCFVSLVLLGEQVSFVGSVGRCLCALACMALTVHEHRLRTRLFCVETFVFVCCLDPVDN